MNKEEFLNRLREALKGLPAAETEKSALYYAEILDDRMEDGMSEVEAVASLGAPEEVAENLKLELPLGTLVRSKMSGSGVGAGTVVLLVLGSPVWLPLLLAGLAVALSLAVSLWAIVLSLWTVVLALMLMLPLSVVGAAMKWANFPAEAVFLLHAKGDRMVRQNDDGRRERNQATVDREEKVMRKGMKGWMLAALALILVGCGLMGAS